jgi:hypothetical protein
VQQWSSKPLEVKRVFALLVPNSRYKLVLFRNDFFGAFPPSVLLKYTSFIKLPLTGKNLFSLQDETKETRELYGQILPYLAREPTLLLWSQD